MNRYVAVNLDGGAVHHNHKAAWDRYEGMEDKVKGVFLITPHGVEGINVCGSPFDITHEQLKNMAQKIADRNK